MDSDRACFFTLVKNLYPDYDAQASNNLYAKWQQSTSGQEEVLEEYVQSLLPKEDEVPVGNLFPAYDNNAIYKAKRWFRARKIELRETLAGVCVSVSAADDLTRFVTCARSLHMTYEQFCIDNNVSRATHAYADFLRTSAGKYIIKERNHPLSSETEYYLCDETEVHARLKKWAIKYTANDPSPDTNFYSVAGAANALQVSNNALLMWAERHPEKTYYTQGRLLFSKSMVIQLNQDWSSVVCIQEMLKDSVEKLPKRVRPYAKQAMFETLQADRRLAILAEYTFPQQQKNRIYCKARTEWVRYVLQDTAESICVYPISCLRQIGVSKKLLDMWLEQELVYAQARDGQLYISYKEQQRIRGLDMEYISLDRIIENISCETRFDLRHSYDRQSLLCRLEETEFDGVLVSADSIPADGGKMGVLIPKEYAAGIKEWLFLWLSCYKAASEDIAVRLLEHFSESYPCTVAALRAFRFSRRDNWNESAFVDVIDMVFSSITVELNQMDGQELREVLIEGNKDRTVTSCTLLAEFLVFAGYTTNQYKFEKAGYIMQNDAYSLNDTASIVAACCNAEIWAKSDLVQKAIHNKRYADMWLFIALHIYATWRKTDFLRLTPPHLYYSAEETLKLLSTGAYPAYAAKYVAEYFLATIELSRATPNKTRRAQNVPPLHAFCPESCKEPFGVILSIATAQYIQAGSSGSFVKTISDLNSIRGFFGKEIARAFGNKAFSSRRMNKSMMQGVEFEAVQGEHLDPNIAYFLASIMRSHKGGYAKIPETTKYYLRDANFSGLTAQQAAYQMMERGVCSMVIFKLLDTCYGERFRELSEASKTTVIKGFGLTPYKTSQVLKLIDEAERTCSETIKDLSAFCAPQKILENFMLRPCMGKSENNYCLLKACGRQCDKPQKQICLGCRYEIKTKQMLVHLTKEIARLSAGSSPEEMKRNVWLRDNIIEPAAKEIIYTMGKMVEKSEINNYIALCKEVQAEHAVDY